VLVGLAAIAMALAELVTTEVPSRQWLPLALLTIISGLATVKLPGVPALISVSETFLFSTVLLFGPAPGVMTVVFDAAFMSLRRGRQPVSQLLFNFAAPALSLWLAAKLFYFTSGIAPLYFKPAEIQLIVGPLLLFTVVYFCLNSGLIAGAIGLQKSISPFWVWRKHLMWLSLNYFGGASVASLLVVYARNVDWTFLAVTVPLLLTFYLTFRTSLARVADANKHLEDLNTLYLATVQTLAAAIDAKDQVTHGHIRRVQHYAVELAKALGVRDQLQLKAIQAAAVLHDTGKIAVPESILNKPGPLDRDEFAIMKQHAAVGADIISAINFPYPVEPIVRHHHENWDGSGYPTGLVGTAIPIGARILAVADCFDALTSDRPYRLSMSDAEALAIISERRGKMYDPLVVDTFFRVYPDLRALDLDDSSEGLKIESGRQGMAEGRGGLMPVSRMGTS
jgi:putative nucleotidyltransferase with HDIG domain